jgi:hypothetical protein
MAGEFEGLGIDLVVLDQAYTSTPAGRLPFHVLGSIAEFERDLIRDRVSAGIAAARRRGRCFGRPRALSGGYPMNVVMAGPIMRSWAHNTSLRRVAERLAHGACRDCGEVSRPPPRHSFRLISVRPPTGWHAIVPRAWRSAD